MIIGPDQSCEVGFSSANVGAIVTRRLDAASLPYRVQIAERVTAQTGLLRSIEPANAHYHPIVPGAPLNGPFTWLVIHPP
jgi:hypothetical protein